MKLACSNPDWKISKNKIIEDGRANEQIYQHTFTNKPVKLVPEKNKHDKNAVQVFIAGELVGYISRDENVHVRSILRHNQIKYISAFISGGNWKVVCKDGTVIKNADSLHVNVRIAYMG